MSSLSIQIRDTNLAARVDQVRRVRGDKRVAKTARDLLNERMTQLEERGALNQPQSVGSGASSPAGGNQSTGNAA